MSNLSKHGRLPCYLLTPPGAAEFDIPATNAFSDSTWSRTATSSVFGNRFRDRRRDRCGSENIPCRQSAMASSEWLSASLLSALAQQPEESQEAYFGGARDPLSG